MNINFLENPNSSGLRGLQGEAHPNFNNTSSFNCVGFNLGKNSNH